MMNFGNALAMITSIKNNSRRKNKHTPFDKDKKNYVRSKPISSKELTPGGKVKLLDQLKENRNREAKLKAYKMIISLGVTVVLMGIIVVGIKTIFY